MAPDNSDAVNCAHLGAYSVPQFWRLRHLAPAAVASRTAFFAITLSILITGAFSCFNAGKLLNEPFPGFLLTPRLVVGNIGQHYWTGLLAGLKNPDKILAVNDTAVSSIEDFKSLVKNYDVGSPVRYTVRRDGKTIAVTVPMMWFTWLDLLGTFGLEFISGLTFLVIGAVVFILKPDTSVSWAFLLLCFFLSLYNITDFDKGSTGLARAYMLAMTFIPAAGLHLSLIFPERKKLADKIPWISCVFYVVSAVLFIPLATLYPRDAFIPFHQGSLLYLVLAALVLLGSTIRSYLNSSSRLARQRAKVVLSGAAVAFPVPAAIHYLSFGGGSTNLTVASNFLPLPIILFPVSIAYAIVKHNLFDVDVYIKRAVGYVIMTAILAVTYVSLHISMTAFIGPLFGSQGEVTHAILFALLVVFFFNPLNHRIQEGVDKLFFRKQYDFKVTVGSISNVLTYLTDLHEIMKHVIQNVRKELFLDSAGVILLDHDKKNCAAFFLTDGARRGKEQQQDLVVTYDDPLLAVLAQERVVLTRYDIEEDPKYASVRESCSRTFSNMGASLALPLFHGNDFTGMFTLGHKKSGHFYTREDIDLLKTVSSMTSTAIQEAREKGQREILMQLFSKHVSSEVAETIWQQRDHFLDGGRPRSQMLTATVLFTDLAGFSSVSEKTDPQALMTWLNAYLDVVAKMIIDHHGVIDDYFGDGMKANFGVPVPRTTEAEIRQDAINAVNCALDMERQITRLNAAMQEQGRPPLRMRVGIYTGPVVAGSLGSSSRLKYTTVGDTVNIASRLESFDKDLNLPHLATSPCRILVGESTLNYLDSHHKTQPVGELSLKGKDESITAYCVLGRNQDQIIKLETA